MTHEQNSLSVHCTSGSKYGRNSIIWDHCSQLISISGHISRSLPAYFFERKKVNLMRASRAWLATDNGAFRPQGIRQGTRVARLVQLGQLDAVDLTWSGAAETKYFVELAFRLLELNMIGFRFYQALAELPGVARDVCKKNFLSCHFLAYKFQYCWPFPWQI